MPLTATAPADRQTLAAARATLDAVEVSVCIANWNCAALLRRCLASLFTNPQGVSFDVIVVDNASTDGAAAMVAAEFPQVKLVRNAANRGFAAASNQAAALGRRAATSSSSTTTPRSPPAHPPPPPRPRAGQPRRRDDRSATPRTLRRGSDQLSPPADHRRTSASPQPSPLDRPFPRCLQGLSPRFVSARRHAARGGAHGPGGLPRRGTCSHRSAAGTSAIASGSRTSTSRRRCRSRAQLLFVDDVEVIHHGRVSSRANVGFVAPSVTTGYVQFFRKAGVGRWPLFWYKLAVTLMRRCNWWGR